VDARLGPNRLDSLSTRVPFTLSHPAAAALLWPAGRRLGVPLSALAIGAMSPDFEFFLHLSPRALLSHTLLGLFVFCLPAGLAAFAAWEHVARGPVSDLFGIARRSPPHRPSAQWWMLAALGIVLGAATHLLWDGVTHGGYWGAEVWPWLRSPAIRVGGAAVPWFNVLQHLSTLLGGLFVLAWCIAYVRRRGEFTLLWRSTWRIRAVGVILAGAVFVALANGSRGPFGADFWTAQRLLGRIAVGALLGGALGVIVFALRHRRSEGAT
jgi:hypothetical protein